MSSSIARLVSADVDATSYTQVSPVETSKPAKPSERRRLLKVSV